MSKIKLKSFIRFFVIFFLMEAVIEMTNGTFAEARVGGGRSSGRSSSFGGFGSRRSTPPPSQQPYNRNPNNPSGQPAVNPGGGFMRGLAGGMAGGFLGSMLFGSMGHAAGFGGTGGIGFLEILLIAGFVYFGFRWWKGRQQMATTFGQNTVPMDYRSSDRTYPQPLQSSTLPSGGLSTMDSEEASDIFFKIQGAWTRRDLSSVKDLLGGEMTDILSGDLNALKSSQRINRLENISIRQNEVTQSWQEGSVDYATVRFIANLLDYTVDEKTAQVVDGSDSLPVKFEEDWTFAKVSNASHWQLVGIQQA